MSFSDDIARFTKKTGSNTDVVVRKTVFDIGRRLVERTPVGDADYWKSPPPKGYVGGHARANWSHSEGTRIVQELPEIDASGQASIDRIQKTVSVRAAGKVHYIQNSVPYIERLEDGYSRQAPSGMVAVTAAEFQGVISSAIEGLK